MKDKHDNRRFVNKPDKVFDKKADLLYAREKLIYNVTEDILIAMEDAGMSKTKLAERMGKQVSSISRLLAGEQNMTLSTLSDICMELGLEPSLNLNSMNFQQAAKDHPLDDLSKIEYDVLAKSEKFKAQSPYMYQVEVSAEFASANEPKYERLSGAEA